MPTRTGSLARPLFVLLVAVLPSCLCVPASAQAPGASRAHPPRIYTTQRLVGPPPRIDGHLTDPAWQQGDWAGHYTQQNPVEGGKPSEETELKILYDEKYIYVAIRAYDDMEKIARYAARRDAIAGSGDIVGVCFDSYFDHRAGFEFDISSAGSKTDLVLSNEGWDVTWDAVWDGKVAYEPDAWTAEFRIPLGQLRYGPQDEQVWGMHAWRWIDRLQEEDQWNLIPRTGTGRLYNFGELHGIRGLGPRRRIELLPHVVAQAESLPPEAGNPYVGDTRGKAAVGLDAKIGLSSNFTLDGAVNPDFGQVEADPSVVNLTAFETFYEEKRPFFLEGKRIFTLGLPGSAVAGDQSGTLQGDQMFYSRRIGAAPTTRPAVAEGAFVQMPAATSIISAAKVTGETRNGLSVGLLQSVTRNGYADVSLDGVGSRIPVAPTTNYLVGRLQQNWDDGNTIAGGMITSTHRWLPGDGALRRLPTDAVTAAVDGTRFLSNRSYVVEGKLFFSRLTGDTAAILALQTDPVHYYQRPDADYLGVNTGATSLPGHGGTLRVARYGNSKWLWSESARWMSPGLELNDLGYLQQADVILNQAELGFTETEPRGAFRSYGFSVSREDSWDFGALKTGGTTGLDGSATFRNLWGVSGDLQLVEPPIDTRLLRGGPAMRTSGFVSARAGVNSDPSKPVSVSLSAERHFAFEGGGSDAVVSTEVGLRPAGALNLSTNAFWEHNVDDLQYVTTARAGGTDRYLLGRLDQRTLGLTFRANYVITPDLTIQYYGSPFVSSGRYGRFKRATSPRAREYADRLHVLAPSEIGYVEQANAYRVDEGSTSYTFADPDFDFRQFRSNLVARWELRPGAALYVVWSQDRTDSAALRRSLTSGLDALRSAPAANVLLVKLSYWFGL
ncbi:MAG TPA: DUF5916 domain-containing protein [Longimicrobiaceae bacterium]|nr:DUF5916 domain-containing protein [Longimicrobiaceae bacterium]